MYILGDIGNSETKLFLVNSKNRIIKYKNFPSKEINNRVLIYGAGEAGLQTSNSMKTIRNYYIEGFIDDDKKKSYLTNDEDSNSCTLSVKSSSDTFGPQPFLCFKTHTSDYFHDNFDFQVPFREWTYTFDGETLPFNSIEKIGVAVNNKYGTTSVTVLDIKTNKSVVTYYNE